MGLMQEGLRRSGERENVLHPVNLNPSEIKTNRLPLAKLSLEVKIGEVSRMLSVEQKEGKETEELQPQETSKNGFEPFINGGENDNNNLFVNLYGGDFSQKMELNRKGVERVLKIAHLDGKVILTSFVASRKPSSEAQGNELAAKRNLFFGEKIEEDGKDNPLHRVVSVPQGWRIEINDTKITEELMEKKIGGKQLQRTFIRKFNGAFKKGLFECVWREKFSSEKDDRFRRKLFLNGWYIAYPNIVFIKDIVTNPSVFIPLDLGMIFMSFSLVNVIRILSERRRERMAKTIDPNFNLPKFHYPRKIDHPLEYFMPQVEIDKVARSIAFIARKGRTLVRETKPEIK